METTVRVTVSTRLGPKQLAEVVEIQVGDVKRMWKLNQRQPAASAEFTLPRPGRYAYRISATTDLLFGQSLFKGTVTGEGMIDIEGDSRWGYTRDTGDHIKMKAILQKLE